MQTQNIFIVGAGNHSVFPTGALISKVAFYAGYDVKNTSVIGLGVIGGAIASQVRFGSKVSSPLVEKGSVDVLLAFDKLEALRHLNQLNPEGMLITSSEIVPPTSVTGCIEEPFECDYDTAFRQRISKLIELDLQSPKFHKFLQCSILWGAFAASQPFGIPIWEKSITELFGKESSISLMRGFHLGKELATQKMECTNCIIGHVHS